MTRCLGTHGWQIIRKSVTQSKRHIPEQFRDFNRRFLKPGGFARPIGSRERKWNTKTGKANFTVPLYSSADGFDEGTIEESALRLMTLRSNDQFNTTVYGYDDRFRGVKGTRMIVFINPLDLEEFGFADGEIVTLASAAGDKVKREVENLRLMSYSIPRGCIAGYYPELNPLIPVGHHAEVSKVPAAKTVPVKILKRA